MEDTKTKFPMEIIGSAIGGAIGGVIGKLSADITLKLAGWLVSGVIGFAICGTAIGLGIGIARKSKRELLWGTVFGFLGGLMTICTAKIAHPIGVMIAGAMIGAFIGLGLGITRRSITKTILMIVFGLLGGGIGGLIGGLIGLETVVSTAIGGMIGGSFIGLGVSLKLFSKKGLKILGVVVLVFVVVVYGILNFVFSIKIRKEIQKIKAAGQPTSMKELAPPEVPDNENADIFLFDLSELTPSIKYEKIVWTEQEKKKIVDIIGATSSTSVVVLNAQDVQLIRNVVTKNKKELDILQKASLRKYLRFNTDYTKGPAIKIPRYSEDISRNKLLMCRALLYKHDGRIKQALDDYKTSMKLNNLYLQQPFLISAMISVANSNISVRTLRTIIAGEKISNQEYDKLISELDSYKQQKTIVVRKAFLAERAFEIEFLDGLLCFFPKYELAVLAGREPSLTAKILTIPFRPIFQIDYLCMFSYWEKFFNLFDKPYYKVSREWSGLKPKEIFLPLIPNLGNIIEKSVKKDRDIDLKNGYKHYFFEIARRSHYKIYLQIHSN
ncbi:MAG: hypothetical protein AB1349_03365 [Elusimicrobiota bacterium]